MADGKITENTRRAFIGAAGLGVGLAAGYYINPGGKSGKPALQVICHGMMAFKLPKADPKTGTLYGPNIEIYLPYVTDSDSTYDHVYLAGNRADGNPIALTRYGDYTLDLPSHPVPSSYPKKLMESGNMFLFSSTDGMCTCTTPATGQVPFCKITLPVPDDYHGYGDGFNSAKKAIFDPNIGSAIQHCTGFHPDPKDNRNLKKLKHIPMVHVFRYDKVGAAQLLDASKTPVWPDKSTVWKDKVFIYAEPRVFMPTSDPSHFKMLTELMGADLAFASEGIPVGTTEPGDDLIADDDLNSLGDWYTSPTGGGNPADCISGYGS